MRYLLIFIIGFSLFSCSAEKRLARIVKKHPELLKKDTVTITDTTIIPTEVHDTTFHFLASRDTVVLDKGRVFVKYFYNTKDSTIYIQGECKGDTVYKEIRVPFDKIEVKTKPFTVIDWLKQNLLLIIVILLILWLNRK